jgi:IclR family pca regulon transcriptional regulator
VSYTEKSITDHEQLIAEFQRARRDHCSVIDEEYEIGLRSIAVPVFNGRNDLLAALTVSVHSSRMSPEQMLEHILPTLESGARTLSSMV